jgi:FkbM family methyltransferase
MIQLALAAENFRTITGKQTVIFSYRSNDGIFTAREGEFNFHFCRWRRRSRYRSGVQNNIQRIETEYCLHSIEVHKPGVFIDCGANVGELGWWARGYGFSYIPFEPEEIEASCCDLNNFNGHKKTVRKALWKESCSLSFYSKPETGDSSLFDVRGKKGVSWVEAVSLDDYGLSLDAQYENILKLEAEGAEPEILSGATETLEKIKFVAADVGYERGLSRDHTVLQVHDFLLSAGFSLIGYNFRKRVTALFERRQ